MHEHIINEYNMNVKLLQMVQLLRLINTYTYVSKESQFETH